VGVVYARRARTLLETLDLRELTGEERFSILAVAENCASFDSDSAGRLFAAYWGLAPVDKMLALSGDPRLAAEETFVAAVIAEARGDVTEAVRYYQRAFESFNGLGYVRRALMAALALVKLDGDETMRRYLSENLDRTSNYIAASIAAPVDDRLTTLHKHPIVALLPPSQREVVMLICQGKSNREIAASRNVGEQTIKNLLTKHVFRAFGVSSRAALVSACLSSSGTSLRAGDPSAAKGKRRGSRVPRTIRPAPGTSNRDLTLFTEA
jgi:DNA-binding CsgD family transcriptional regulator